MQSGDTVGGRFVIEAAAGGGGMGSIYRATDLATGAIVALKVLRHEQGDANQETGKRAVGGHSVVLSGLAGRTGSGILRCAAMQRREPRTGPRNPGEGQKSFRASGASRG